MGSEPLVVYVALKELRDVIVETAGMG